MAATKVVLMLLLVHALKHWNLRIRWICILCTYQWLGIRFISDVSFIFQLPKQLIWQHLVIWKKYVHTLQIPENSSINLNRKCEIIKWFQTKKGHLKVDFPQNGACIWDVHEVVYDIFVLKEDVFYLNEQKVSVTFRTGKYHHVHWIKCLFQI